jgi:cytochrome c biogenesis protein ResB
VKELYRFLKSVRLAIVLILVIIVISLLATLVPQGRPDEWYLSAYRPFVYGLIKLFSLGSFFGSAFFLIPVALFAVNLGVCAVDRVVVRARNHARRRYGPDLVHIGLLVLIASGLVTATLRHEKTLQLAEGDEAAVGSVYLLHLDSFQYLTYDSGAPKDWISTVDVSRAGAPIAAGYKIEVNHPLRLKGYTVYQSSWDTEGLLDVTDAAGDPVTATTGQGFQEGESFWYFSEVTGTGAGARAVFNEYKGDVLASSREVGVGESIGPFLVKKVSTRLVTGLKVVEDPGYVPFLVALGLILVGLALTFIQKRGDTPQ